jgi:hypothetical protein
MEVELARKHPQLKRFYHNHLQNFRHYPTRITADDLIYLVKKRAGDFFNLLPNDYYHIQNLPSNSTTYPAITIKRLDLRIIPTNTPQISENGNDLLQLRSINPAVPLQILHKTTDERWTLVQYQENTGWVTTEGLALLRQRRVKKPKKFISILSTGEMLGNDYLPLGTQLQLLRESKDFYLVAFPIKDPQGYLHLEPRKLPKSSSLTVGHLPYTKKNLLYQAFRYYHTPYGWGEINGLVDCSGFIKNIYGVFGFQMPKHSGDQHKTIGRSIAIKNNTPDIQKLLDNSPMGTLLYFPGHIMFYLGTKNGKHYILHAICFNYMQGQKIFHRRIQIDTLEDLTDAAGDNFLQKITTIIRLH